MGGEHRYRNKINFIMASSTSKRPHLEDSDDEENNKKTNNIQADQLFIVIESQTDQKLADLSPFIIEKVIEHQIGTPETVKKNSEMEHYW